MISHNKKLYIQGTCLWFMYMSFPKLNLISSFPFLISSFLFLIFSSAPAGLYRRSCLVLVVSKPQWHRCAVVPDCHLHCQKTLSSTHLSESSISECVRLCDAHNYGLYPWYVTTFCVTFLSVTHHVRTCIRTL